MALVVRMLAVNLGLIPRTLVVEREKRLVLEPSCVSLCHQLLCGHAGPGS